MPSLVIKAARKWMLFFIASASFSTTLLSAQQLPQTPPPLPVVEEQLEKAQKDFKEAQKMFNPWYAGPLLTPSAHNVPPGHFNIQPYLFVTATYGRFDRNRTSRSIPTVLTINPSFVYQMGLFDWLDFTATLRAFYNKQSGTCSFHFGDTKLTWGIPLFKETPYRPAVRFALSTTFPTGKYNRLSPSKKGIDATGAGTYRTALSLNMSKIFWWFVTHPFRVRFSLNYSIPTTARVKDLSVYGGGSQTSGRVRPGNGIEFDSSIEWSFTKKWVLTLDLIYTYINHATFSGRRGLNSNGTAATVGLPSGDSFSVAPAIQYNPSTHMGLLVGGWVAITGRNAANFASGIVTFSYYW